MIFLNEVAQKLEALLNDSANPLSETYTFRVETEGFHIDHIEKADKSGNFIPVFISSMGGQFNPVKGLKQGSFVIPIAFYYPVRFKDDFFALQEYLAETFVGTKINYGTLSGKAVSNISAAQFGEIQDLDLKRFDKWIMDTYKKPIDVNEPYISMNVTLYLSTAAPGLLFGNDIKVNFSFKHGDKEYSLTDIAWDGSSLQSNSQTQSEQAEDAEVPESEAFPYGTGYGSSFKIYPNLDTLADNPIEYVQESGTYDPDAVYYRKQGNNYILIGKLTQIQYEGYHSGSVVLYVGVPCYFYREFLKIWLSGKIQEVEATVTFIFGDPSYGISYTRKSFIQSVVAPFEKGQLVSLTLNFAKLVEEEQEEEQEE